MYNVEVILISPNAVTQAISKLNLELFLKLSL